MSTKNTLGKGISTVQRNTTENAFENVPREVENITSNSLSIIETLMLMTNARILL